MSFDKHCYFGFLRRRFGVILAIAVIQFPVAIVAAKVMALKKLKWIKCMRIWSLHPKYLDAKGLVALWRETLLAQNVLVGKTKGYKNHPQLSRFKALPDPVAAIGDYLNSVYEEAVDRGYNFNKEKILERSTAALSIPVTSGQLTFEFSHLKRKLKIRDPENYKKVIAIDFPETHPIFKPVKGEIEGWEKV